MFQSSHAVSPSDARLVAIAPYGVEYGVAGCTLVVLPAPAPAPVSLHVTAWRLSPSSDSIAMVLMVGLRRTSTVFVRFISKRVTSVRCSNQASP